MIQRSVRLKTVFLYTSLSMAALFMVLPFWVMLISSLSPAEAFYQGSGPLLWSWPWTLDHYVSLFEQVAIGRYLLNSVLVSVLTTFFHVAFCAMAGYAFSRLQFPGRNALFFVFLITLMIPPQVNMVPLFFLMKLFGWMDSYAALIIPGCFGAFGVFLFRQHFNAIPIELEEAACLDGCNPWQRFFRVILPLAWPPLAALSIFVFITSWNSFLWPLVVTHSDSLRTLPVGLAALKESFRDSTNWPLLMAAATLSTLPVMAVFLVGQRYFVQGLLAGSVKE